MDARSLRIVVAEGSVNATLRQAFSLDAATVIAGVATDGLQAVALTRKLRPDAVVIDARMPRIDGFEATRRIMSETPTPIVIVAENVDQAAVQVSMEALRAGALAAVQKPIRAGTSEFAARSAMLVATVRTMADVKVVRRWPERPTPRLPVLKSSINLAATRPALVAIGASTGGPAALYRILTDLRPTFPLPILVTQHIACGFVDGMIRWLDAAAPLKVKLAKHGEPLQPSTVYVADDNHHLTVLPNRTIALTEDPAVDGHRPSATVLFRSVADAFGPKALAVVLTGMGRDGTDGLGAVQRAGGLVLAQDEPSSAVFGMPKAAIDAGVTNLVLPLEAIADHLTLTAMPA